MGSEFENASWFAGKTALVTGAGKRLGRAIALGLARLGTNVVVHYRDSEAAARDAVREIESLGVGAVALQSDLENPDETAALFARAVDAMGAVDYLANSASVFPSGTLRDLAPEDLEHSLRIDALAPLALTHALAAQGRAGAVVNLLDARIVDYDKEHAAYHLSKRMLFSLTRMMAVEFAPLVRVNAVAPGLILPPAGKDEAYLKDLAHTNPLQRHGNAEDVVDAVLFLLRSEFVTGQVIFVDGGRHMRGSMYGC